MTPNPTLYCKLPTCGKAFTQRDGPGGVQAYCSPYCKYLAGLYRKSNALPVPKIDPLCTRCHGPRGTDAGDGPASTLCPTCYAFTGFRGCASGACGG